MSSCRGLLHRSSSQRSWISNALNTSSDVEPALKSAAGEECRQAAGADYIRSFSWQPDFSNQNWTLLLMPVVSSYYIDDARIPQPVLFNGQDRATYGSRRASLKRAPTDLARIGDHRDDLLSNRPSDSRCSRGFPAGAHSWSAFDLARIPGQHWGYHPACDRMVVQPKSICLIDTSWIFILK